MWGDRIFPGLGLDGLHSQGCELGVHAAAVRRNENAQPNGLGVEICGPNGYKTIVYKWLFFLIRFFIFQNVPP